MSVDGTQLSPALWRDGDPPLLAWYGDDFTGAAAVLDVLAFAGVPGALFLRRPTKDEQTSIGPLAAIGLAGTARAESPDWMREHLPPVFDWLATCNAALTHYKICSTLDSSPLCGSIGCAADLAQARFAGAGIPCLVAAPWMGRWQAFGQLFARGPDGSIHRLDRHPVMSRHPVTPMHEADVAKHLAAQTALGVAPLMQAGSPSHLGERFDALLADGAGIVCLDAADDAALQPLGELLWSRRDRSPFVLGSQGVQRALVDHWRAYGLLPPEPSPPPPHAALTLGLSGSVSQTTAGQIAAAERAGWRLHRLDVVSLASDRSTADAGLALAEAAAVDALAQGQCPLLYTARGPDDGSVPALTALARRSGEPIAVLQRRVGDALGTLLHRVLATGVARRAVIAGGDSSGRSLTALDALALRDPLPVSPGLSMYRLVASGPFDDVHIALKGGQMGDEDCFEAVRRGGSG